MAFRRLSTSRPYQTDIWMRDLDTGEEWSYAEVSAKNLSFGPGGTLLGELASFSLNVQTVYDVSDPNYVVEMLPLESGWSSSDNQVSEFQGIWKGNYDAGLGRVVYEMVDYSDGLWTIHSDDSFYRNTTSHLIVVNGRALMPDALGVWRDQRPMWFNRDTILFVSDRQTNHLGPWFGRNFDIFAVSATTGYMSQITCTEFRN